MLNIITTLKHTHFTRSKSRYVLLCACIGKRLLEKSQSHVCDQKFEEVYDQNWQVSVDALFRCSDSFIPGSLSLCWRFWKSCILKGHLSKNNIFSWLKHGVHINYFFGSIFKGHNGVEINSHLAQPYKEQNHIKQEFKEWVSSEKKS